MAYAVNLLTKVFTIPLADLTFVSGVNYTLDVDEAHREIRMLEWAFSYGLWAEHAIDYINSQTLSGITYSPVVKMVNGYTWDVDATNINISLVGSNTNLLDAYIPGNGVSVLVNNSAGKVLTGISGVTEQDKDDIAEKSRSLFFSTDSQSALPVGGIRTHTP